MPDKVAVKLCFKKVCSSSPDSGALGDFFCPGFNDPEFVKQEKQLVRCKL